MSEANELEEPQVTPVPEPDQEPHEPLPDEADTTTEETLEEEAAEAETDVGEPGEAVEGAEGETEPGEAAPSAKQQRDQQKAVDKMFDAFEREAARHTGRVAEIAGDSATDLLQCPMCAPEQGQPQMPGWLLPVKPSEEKIANVRVAIGLAPKISYREDPHSKVCPECGGLKSVVPAGMEQGGVTLPCALCKSQGWVATDNVRAGGQTNGEVPSAVTFTQSQPPTLEPDSPEVAALKQAGYTVIAPYRAEA